MTQQLCRFALTVGLVFLGSSATRSAVTTTGDVAPVPPAAGGNVVGPIVVGNTATGTLNVTAGTAITSTQNATVGATATGIGVVTLNGLGSDWSMTTGTADLTVGSSGVGSIALSNLARLNTPDDSTLGSTATGIGRVTVNGLGTVWTNGGNILVGNGGQGVLDITGGGQVTSGDSEVGNSIGSNGQVTVSGELSRWQVTGGLTVGDAGAGTLIIEDGGRVSQTLATLLGASMSAFGVAEIRGAGSTWSLGGGIGLGNGGSGTLRVLSGGRVNTGGSISLASQAGAYGELLVDGPDSLLAVTGSIASIEEALVTISNGGILRMSSIGNLSSQTRLVLDGGRMEVSGPGSFSMNGLIVGSGVIDLVGNLNAARMYAGPGDHLIVTTTVSTGGSVDLDGGQLDTGIGLTIAVNGRANLQNGAILRSGTTGVQIFNGAQLSVTGGNADIMGLVSNSAGGEIAVVGNSMAVFHDIVTNNGTIFVAPGSQMVTLEDLGFVAGSTLSVQLTSVGPTDDAAAGFGRVVGSGQASLDGTLHAALMDGFQPALEDTFQIVSAEGGRSGMFASESLPPLPGFLGWDVVYSPNAVTLAVVPALAGDYNVNGVVDAADYVVWRNSLGQAGIGLAADGDADGVVDAGDYQVWMTNFGSAAASAAQAASVVPEPAGIALLALAMLCASQWRANTTGQCLRR